MPRTVDPERHAARRLVIIDAALGGRLMVATATDPVDLRGGDIEVKELLEAHGPFAVYLDPEDRVHLAVLNDSGQVVREDQATTGPVMRAWAAREGGAFAYVDPSGATYVWPTGADAPTPLPLDTAPQVATVDVFGDGNIVFASAEGRTLSVTAPDGEVHTVETAAEVTDIDIGGPTIAVQTDAGVEIHDLDGDLRYPATGSRTGALSADGHWYIAGASRTDLDEGPAPTLRLVNATSGEVEPFLVQATGPVSDVWWQDEDRFLVIVGEHPRDLYSCTVCSRSCDSMNLHDDTDTLRLPVD